MLNIFKILTVAIQCNVLNLINWMNYLIDHNEFLRWIHRDSNINGFNKAASVTGLSTALQVKDLIDFDSL
jgi:hypothetical protein